MDWIILEIQCPWLTIRLSVLPCQHSYHRRQQALFTCLEHNDRRKYRTISSLQYKKKVSPSVWVLPSPRRPFSNPLCLSNYPRPQSQPKSIKKFDYKKIISKILISKIPPFQYCAMWFQTMLGHRNCTFWRLVIAMFQALLTHPLSSGYTM